MLRDVVSDARVRLRAAGFLSQAGLVRQLGVAHIRSHAPVLLATLREALLKGKRLYSFRTPSRTCVLSLYSPLYACAFVTDAKLGWGVVEQLSPCTPQAPGRDSFALRPCCRWVPLVSNPCSSI